MESAARRPRLLVVGGVDPTGGAGIDADRAGVADLCVDVDCVVTADTEQDQAAVHAIGARDPDRWLAEAMRSTRAGIAALKLGLLPGERHIAAAATLVENVREHAALPVVLDPVIGASSGGRFLDERAVAALRAQLCPLGIVITPNVPEAAELVRDDADELADSPRARLRAARALIDLGVFAVVLKAGHGREDPAEDLVLARGTEPVWLPHARVIGGKIRGSGCRFAARLAAEMALGRDLVSAARSASEHVVDAIRLRAQSG